MRGPEQERLARDLQGSRTGQVSDAEREWERAAGVLMQVSLQLQGASHEPPGRIGNLTGEAVARAFRRSAEAMAAKAEELREGGVALGAAKDTIESAQLLHADLASGGQGQRPAALTFTGPMTAKDIRNDSERNAEIAAWDAEYERRERRAREAADRMDATFTESSVALRKIHRETPPEDQALTAPGGGSSSGRGGATSPSGPGSTDGSGGPAGTYVSGGGHAPSSPAPSEDPTGATPAPGQGAGPQPGTTTTSPALGAPQGPSGTRAPELTGSVADAATAATSPASSTGAGVALGGLAVGGGMLAAGTAAGTVRGGATPVASAGASQARPIGAGSSRGAAPTLGRAAAVPGSAAGTSGSQARAAGRAGSASPSRAALGRSAVSAAPAGERGASAAGQPVGRGQGRGSSGTGRSGRGRTRPQQSSEVAGYAEEWEIDDPDAAPGVLD